MKNFDATAYYLLVGYREFRSLVIRCYLTSLYHTFVQEKTNKQHSVSVRR